MTRIGMLQRSSRWQRGIVLALVGLAGIGLFPVLQASAFYASVVAFAGIYGLMALGLNLLIGYTGQFSFGHSAFAGIGAYTTAILTTRFGVLPLLALIAGAVLTAVVAVLVGYPTLRLKGHYLAMATGALAVISFTLFVEWDALTNGYMGIGSIPRLALGPLVLDSPVHYAYLAWLALALGIQVSQSIVNSRVGLAMRAVRGNEPAALASGVDSAAYKLQIFVVSAVYAAVAGSIQAHFMTFISPEPFSLALAITLVTMVFVGGAGTIWGPVVGATVLTLLSEGLRAYQDYNQLFYGILLIAVLVFMPLGIYGTVRGLGQRVLSPWAKTRPIAVVEADRDEREATHGPA